MASGAARYSALATSASKAPARAGGPAENGEDDDNEKDDGALGAVELVPAPVVVPPARAEQVEVTAPADLPGGYELPCDHQGRSILVRVPPEGVWRGQQFVADVVRKGDGGDADIHGHRIPAGRWRDGCCDCLANGVCHPALWLACLCKPLAIGQVMTRVGLTATGAAIAPDDSHRAGRTTTSTFKVVVFIMVVFLATDCTLSLVWLLGSIGSHEDSSIPAWMVTARLFQYAIEVMFWTYLLVALTRTRSHVRRRYRIPEQYCPSGRCEDCCCACWLPCCTTLQIARHTADYQRYPAACCSETGLYRHEPHMV